MSLRAGEKTDEKVPGSRARRVFRRIFLILLLFALVAALLILWVWTQRLSIVENEIKNQLEARGIDAELSLTELGEFGAGAENVIIKENGKTIIGADSVRIDYIWRDALEGKFERLTIDGVTVDLDIDAKGRPQLAMLDNRGESKDGLTLPPGGIIITNGSGRIGTPYGTAQAEFEGAFFSEQNFNLSAKLEPADFAYGDLSANISGPVKIKRAGPNPEFETDLSIPSWAYKELSGRGGRLSGAGVLSVTETGAEITGDFEALFEEFSGKAVGSDDGRLKWDGTIVIPRQSGGVLRAGGDWQAGLNNLAMDDPARRRALSERIALYEALSKAPVAEDFARPVERAVDDLLKSGDVSGQGRIEKTDDVTQIYMDGDIIWENARRKLTATAIGDTPLYDYKRDREDIDLSFNADFKTGLPLQIKQGRLTVRSTNGRNIKGVKSFTGILSLPRDWTGQTADGQSANISRTTATIDYSKTDRSRRLTLSGPIGFEGNIPGGYVTGLSARGRLDMDMQNGTRIFFTPSGDQKITMDSFTTQAPWIARNVSFNLAETAEPVFVRRPGGGVLTASLSDLSSDLISTEGPRSLRLSYGAADIKADIDDGLQNWDVKGRDVVMTSDNMPSADTRMTAPAADMTVKLQRGLTPKFTVAAPVADVQTEAIDGKGLAVRASGTTDKFRVNYENGDVDFIAADLPRFDMTGYIEYENNVWAGMADTVLPFGPETPVDVKYRFENGRGYADVDIPEMIFSPRGLQPQMFITPLRGKIADVRGRSSAKLHLEFAPGEPMTSSGSAVLTDVEVGTLPGPLTGVNAELKFSSIFPLVTEGVQNVSIATFDPGFPLPDGSVSFEAVPDGIKIHAARWPLGSGFVSLDPTEWNYSAAENRMQLRIENVSLGEFLGNIAGENFNATGNVNGVLPVVISGVDVRVEQGRLEVKDGGVIRYQSDQTNAASAENEIAGYAFDALKEFRYQELEAIMNGPLDGTIILRLMFEGQNPEVLGGAVFRFNVTLEGELLNIARSFQLGDRIAEEIEKAIISER